MRTTRMPEVLESMSHCYRIRDLHQGWERGIDRKCVHDDARLRNGNPGCPKRHLADHAVTQANLPVSADELLWLCRHRLVAMKRANEDELASRASRIGIVRLDLPQDLCADAGCVLDVHSSAAGESKAFAALGKSRSK
jgi:hypothetical protein